MQEPLLYPDEPSAVEVLWPHGRSAFFVICDHAGARIPRRLRDLGLGAADRERHIAWDIGAAAVARRMGAAFDACVVLQTYSRLVIDCNRAIGTPTSIAAVSERTPIPGNQSISAADAARREREVFRPYHDRIRALLDARRAAQRTTLLVSMHSFTPSFLGETRPWHAAVLYHRDTRLARALLRELREDAALRIGDNEPYAVSDATDYAIPAYGERLGLPHVEIEVRQDLIADDAGQRDWAERLADALRRAAAAEGFSTESPP